MCTRYLQTDSAQTVPTLQLAVVLTVVAGAGLILFIAVPTWAHALFTAARRQHQQRRAAHAQQEQAQQADDACKKASPQQSTALDVVAAAVAVDLPPADPKRQRTLAQDHLLAALALRGNSSIATSDRLKLVPAPSQLTAAGAKRERCRAWRKSYGTAAIIGTLVALQALTLVRPLPLSPLPVYRLIYCCSCLQLSIA